MPGSCSTACGSGPETIGTSSRFCCECGLTELSMRFLHNGANSLLYGKGMGPTWARHGLKPMSMGTDALPLTRWSLSSRLPPSGFCLENYGGAATLPGTSRRSGNSPPSYMTHYNTRFFFVRDRWPVCFACTASPVPCSVSSRQNRDRGGTRRRHEWLQAARK